ncbi:MAG: hypothetical protein IPM42_17685 [Saprospiraceae bacterium]|nr:hypothetical protein [Saprospiraceae bacterium]
MRKIFMVIQLSLMLASTIVYSQEAETPLKAKFLIEGGLEYGGDEILKVFFTNGEDQTMRAGQGGYLAVGGQLEFSKVKNLMLRASVGIKYNTTAAENANIRLTRIPFNLIPYLKIKEDFRIGLGITSHQSVKFRGDGFAPDIDFTSSVGPRFEFGYKWIALTYTSISYTAETDEKFSASSIGLSLSYAFPNK